MRLSFDSIDEVKAFVAELKGTRGSKSKPEHDAGDAGSTAQIGTGGAGVGANPGFNVGGATGFNAPQGQAAGQTAGGFPVAGAGQGGQPVNTGPHPLVKAIIDRAEQAVASGQNADNVVGWFKQQLGPDATQANWQQIKEVFLPRLNEAQLKQIAPQLGLQV